MQIGLTSQDDDLETPREEIIMTLKPHQLFSVLLLVSACSLGAGTVTAAPIDTETKTLQITETSDASTITVHVTGFNVEAGSIMVALTDKAGYESGNAVRGAMAVVDSDIVTLTFENIPTGTYALRMYHDADGNGELNANAFGIPTEPFAFSNNAKGVMGPASWEDAQFTHGPDGTTQNISF